jgi:chaperone required for assembly of F1-ATPase
MDAIAGLGIAVPALGSLVLGLALAAGEIDANTAYTLGALDELFQAEQWGEDYEAVDRRTSMLADIVLAARYIDLTRGDW